MCVYVYAHCCILVSHAHDVLNTLLPHIHINLVPHTLLTCPSHSFPLLFSQSRTLSTSRGVDIEQPLLADDAAAGMLLVLLNITIVLHVDVSAVAGVVEECKRCC